MLVIQDESTFYTNEGKICFDGNCKRKIAKKGNGESVVTSGFMCLCHGFMVDDDNGGMEIRYEVDGEEEGPLTNVAFLAQ